MLSRKSLIGDNHYVYFDNYLTSLPLLRELKQKKIHACSTIKVNRIGTPEDFIPEKLMERGHVQWRFTDDGISYMKWKDNRASNFHKPEIMDTVDRKKKDS